MTNATPLLSVVVTSRNDDHGGSLLRRMQTFVNGLINQCKRHNLHAELILVEWNPPPDRPRFAQALHWPHDPSPCEVRIIEVPPERHARLKHSEALPLFQMIAKNVGIRRARGQFILATNIDIIFSDELIRYMTSGQLRSGRMYRIDRYDVMTDVPVDAPVEEQLEYCQQHMIRINARDGTYNLMPDGMRALAPEDIVPADAHILLGDNWYSPECDRYERFRWVGNDAIIYVQVPFSAVPADPPALSLVMEPGPGVGNRPFALEVLDVNGKTVAQGVVDGRQRVSLMLPIEPGRKETFTFHVTDGDRPVPFDSRTMNYRVFDCGWAPGFPVISSKIDSGEPYHLKAEDVGVVGAKDIAAAGDGIRFGRGFHPVECWNEEIHRWVSNGATLFLTAPVGAAKALRLEVEPGPGAGFGKFQLQLKDRTGQLVSHGIVDQRQWITVFLPIEPGQSGQFTFHAAGVGSSLNDDARGLLFRIFHCQWDDSIPLIRAPDTSEFVVDKQGALARKDIASAESGIRFGSGWYPVETTDSEIYRWAANDASIMIQTPEERIQALRLEMKPGPGVKHRSFELQVRDAQGKVVARGKVEGRRRIALLLPLRHGQTDQFTLHVDNGDHVSKHDPRRLTFCVFRCDWAPAWAKAAIDAEPLGPWNFKSEKVDSWRKFVRKSLRVTQSKLRTLFVTLVNLYGRQILMSSLLGYPKNGIIEPVGCPVPLHTNACGDFTLMAREHWFELRGHPEFEIFSLHIDSIMCYATHHGGAPEEMLREPMRIYHIEHGAGSGWTPEGAAKLMERITAKGIPVLDYRDLYLMATEMRRRKKPLQFNRKNWGMAGEQLPETIIGQQAQSPDRVSHWPAA